MQSIYELGTKEGRLKELIPRALEDPDLNRLMHEGYTTCRWSLHWGL